MKPKNQVEYRPVSKLKELPGNPRTINKDQFEKLKASISANADYFEARPCILSDRTGELVVIAGNQRLKAAKALKMTEIPTVLLPGLTEEREKEIIIRDNVENGDWDMDILANEWDVEQLDDWGVDGLDNFVTDPEDIIEDEAPDPPEEPTTKPGEIWQLGEHRLMCGDSTKKEDVDALMGGGLADMVFTDPPYGIDYSGGRTQVVRDKDYGKIKNDDLQGDNLGKLISQVFSHNVEGADIYICVSPIMQKPFLDFIEIEDKKIDAVIVWDKKQPGLGYMAYRRQCEFILFIKGGEFHKGDKSDIDLWSIGRDDGATYVHGTQKPVAVSGRAIKNSSKDGDTILDLFGGSGSTLMACEQFNRKCYMMELDPHYCDVIIKRWENFTGEKARKIDG